VCLHRHRHRRVHRQTTVRSPCAHRRGHGLWDRRSRTRREDALSQWTLVCALRSSSQAHLTPAWVTSESTLAVERVHQSVVAYVRRSAGRSHLVCRTKTLRSFCAVTRCMHTRRHAYMRVATHAVEALCLAHRPQRTTLGWSRLCPWEGTCSVSALTTARSQRYLEAAFQ
jgi:hypothetical protein